MNTFINEFAEFVRDYFNANNLVVNNVAVNNVAMFNIRFIGTIIKINYDGQYITFGLTKRHSTNSIEITSNSGKRSVINCDGFWNQRRKRYLNVISAEYQHICWLHRYK